MYNARVNIVYRDASKMIFRVYPDKFTMRYAPGQYGALGLQRGAPRIDQPAEVDSGRTELIKRPYSIANPVLDDNGTLVDTSLLDFYEFYVDLVIADEHQKPRLSPRLFALRDDDRIFMADKIVGHYTLDMSARGKNLLFIATTTGESPHNSMVTDVLRRGDECHVCNIIIGRPGWISAYQAKHRLLMEAFLTYHCLTVEDDETFASTEALMETSLSDGARAVETLGWALDPESTHVFLCGDPTMIGAPVKLGGWQYQRPASGLMRLFERHGFRAATRFQQGSVNYESYW